jgi:hypothetical protein
VCAYSLARLYLRLGPRLVVAARHRAAATGIEVELEMSIEGQDDVSEKLEMDPRLPDTVAWLDEEPPRKTL